MNSAALQWLTTRLHRMVDSIAFYPAFISICFLVLSHLMVGLDFSEFGKDIKARWEWLRLKDASTARSTISVVAAGILSLTVFSFTMVMVVLNQAASQMSNRVLDNLIGNRYQQITLGFYIGTIVYALFLLTSIRDIDSGIYVPALSTYLLIAFAIIDIFFFIYFLHHITQSIKYGVIIRRIYKQTLQAMKKTCRLAEQPQPAHNEEGDPILSSANGIFLGFNKEGLMELAEKQNCRFSFIYPLGTFLLKDSPLLLIAPVGAAIEANDIGEIMLNVNIGADESVDSNFQYGFRQLTEVAVKALSPGINDPGTAVESLRAIFALLSFRLNYHPDTLIKDKKEVTRIVTNEYSFEELFESSVLPIWDYGKGDRFINSEMRHLLRQLLAVKDNLRVRSFIHQVESNSMT